MANIKKTRTKEYLKMENTIRKLTDGMNEAISETNTKYTGTKRTELLKACAKVFQSLDVFCDIFGVEMPDEAVHANAHLDDFFDQDILSMKF